MRQARRALLGFFVAPIVPTLPLFIVGLLMGHGAAACVLPVFAAFFGYVGALLIGVPMYLLLERQVIRRLRAYLLAGAFIGPILYLVTGRLMSLPGMAMPSLPELFIPIVVLAAYSAFASAVFWRIVVKEKLGPQEVFWGWGLD